MLAARISEYGIMMIGLVGSARYGCGADGTALGGDVDVSWGLCERLFAVFTTCAAVLVLLLAAD